MVGESYFVGLDIGTNSVGAAVTDKFYRILRFKGNAMWTSAVFDSAQQASDRRINRTSRRSLDRRQQRRDLLQELLAPAILPVDPNFFIRIRESALWAEDKTTGSRFTYFSGDGYTDCEYHRDYPTIHHLIIELMTNGKPHDPRLVYIACSYILTHRGHFLNPAAKDKIDDILKIEQVYRGLAEWFENTADTDCPFKCSAEEFGKVLTENRGVQNRTKAFYDLLFGGKKPKRAEDDAVDCDVLLKLISGGKIELSKLFLNEDYAELDYNKIELSDAEFDDKEAELRAALGDDFGLIAAAKNIYDWSLMTGLLDGEKSISAAKVKVYEKHKADLAALRRIIRKYRPDAYGEVFRCAKSGLDNYTRYSGNVKSSGKITDAKYSRCDQAAFCDYLKKTLKNVVLEDGDTEFERVMSEITDHTFCPRQISTDNRVIPYQLYYTELKAILDNARNYIPQLNNSDEYGTVSDKILLLMTFRIPYYVGPLVKKDNNDNAWIVRKAEGRILPWNFDELVDKDRCEDEFIRRMTCKCTYIAGEDVLPKNSLLYCKFLVLNEINNIRINGDRSNFTPAAKQLVFTELFEKKRKVTVKMIKELLITYGYMKPEDTLGGIDNTVKSSLKSFHDFRNMLASGVLSEEDAEKIIERLTCTTDIARFRKWLEKFGLSESDSKYVGRLKYSDFGRLSRTLLTEICDVDAATGEVIHPNIITMMWENNLNLMELLSQNYGYRIKIDELNREYYDAYPRTLDERMDEMYLPSAVRRPVKRAVEIVREYRKIQGRAPERIFIEMARELTDPDKKGKRTSSRRNTILEYFKEFPQEETEGLRRQLEKRSDDELRSEKLYLYFIQLGRCMYSGQSIDIESLGSKLYDVDHIFPQSKVKDDSIENKVLVLSDLNGAKSDKYPIAPEVRRNMHSFWEKLHKNGLIGDKKYERLTRSAPFTDDELADFISRQLVETRQSTKAVAQLLKEEFPESEIVYVKAGLASQFRQEYEVLKCRELNDLHHAKDAYLNIVMGNIYFVKFTKNPMNFVKEYRSKQAVYDLKIKSMLSHDVIRNGEVAWKGDGSWLEAVKKQLGKNNIRYVKYTFRRKGALFNLLPERKNPQLVCRKKELPAGKYGGYNNTTASFFALVKYHSIKASGVVIMPVELMFAERFERDVEFAENYALDVLNDIVSLKSGDILQSVEFPLGSRIIKINAMLDIDGFRANIVQKSNKGRTLVLAQANSLIISQKESDYFKRLVSVCTKITENERNRKEYKIVPDYDRISREENLDLYDLLVDKTSCRPYSVMLSKVAEKFVNGSKVFESLNLEQQTKALVNMFKVLKSGRSDSCDLRLIGDVEKAAVVTLNSDLSKLKGYSSIRIIDQSPTGLYERISPNLLTL